MRTEPLANYRAIRDELVRYDATLGERPEIVVLSKAELPGAADVREDLAAAIGREVLAVSAVTGAGLDALVRAAVRELDREPRGPAAGAMPASGVPAPGSGAP